VLRFSYIVKATSPDGASSFTAYSYAGELPTCAFGFNSNGVVRLLSSLIRGARHRTTVIYITIMLNFHYQTSISGSTYGQIYLPLRSLT
jgi:hypothetical protein